MHMFVSLGAPALAFLAQIGTSALAADGPVIITQATALAGGVTPGDEPGFPVSIRDPGSYLLGSNLNVAPGKNGIVVSAQNVTIDLNGFALNGRNKAKHGVTFGRRAIQSLEVRNGAIAKFADSAINVSSSTIGVFQNLRIHSNGGDGILTGQDARVVNNTIVLNMGAGIKCGYCHIEGNLIIHNQEDGILTSGGNVLGNVIKYNKGYGINAPFDAVGAANNTLFWNGDSAEGGPQMVNVRAMQPNFCEPECNYADPPPP